MPFEGPLAAWLRDQPGLLPIEQVAAIVRKAADVIQQLHNQQIVHQDINTSSFVIRIYGENTERFDLQLANFSGTIRVPSGYQRSYSRSYPVNSQLAYMAPEQWNGQAVPATDQYALAAMAYELLTGQPPFQGPPIRLLDLHTNVQPAAPSSMNPRVSRPIDAVILTAMAKRPEDRFPAISAFARALEQAVRSPAEAPTVNITGAANDGNLHATLLINRAEAATGALRTVTLPQGRRITVAVPAGAYDGQIIRLEGFGDPTAPGRSSGAVLLSIAVNPTETSLPTVGNARGDLPTEQKAEQKTKTTITIPFALSSPKTMVSGAYSKFTGLTPLRRALLLASLVLVLILAGTGLFSLVQTTEAVSIPYPPNKGAVALSDSLRDNSKGYGWPEGNSADGGACQFTQGAYHVSITRAGTFHYCVAGSPNFSNFAYQVRMTIIKGDGGGLIFRADGANNKFYYFRIGYDGSYALYQYVDANGTHAKTLASGVTPTIHTGFNVPNLLAVVANNGSLNLYVNEQQVASVNDNAYTGGQVGVGATYLTGLTEVMFSDANVWTF